MAVTFRGTRAELQAALADLPRAIAGLAPDPTGAARSLQLRIGVTLLSLIQQACVEKARGGTGSDGIRWKPLDPRTIAGRKVSAADRRAAGVRGRRVRGLLTPKQDKEWRKIFATRKARLVLRGMDEGSASALAARLAWAALKAQGAQTKLAAYGSRQVEIGRDTGRLFRSLNPGVEDRPSRAAEQVMETVPGAVIVGTNVAYAGPFHRRRPLWPERLPAQWWKVILASLERGLARVLVRYLAQAGRGTR